MTDRKSDSLPTGWATAALKDLLIFVLGGDWGKAPDHDDPDYADVRCIRASEVRDWPVDRGVSAAHRRIKRSSLLSRQLQQNDIVLEISGGGPEQPVGRTLLIDEAALKVHQDIPKVCTNFFRLIRPSDETDAKYLNTYLQYFYRSGRINGYQGGSNNLRNLKFNDYLDISIPIPPKAEQERLVSKIEELLSELDKGMESLTTALEQLKVYRQAVLKSAFEGRLSEQWRERNRKSLESADEVVNRIQQERDVSYNQRYSEWKKAIKEWDAGNGAGRKPKRPLKPKQYAALSKAESASAAILPDGWQWRRLGEIALVGTGVTPLKANAEYYIDGDVPWVTSGALNDSFVREPSGFVTVKALNDTNLRLYTPNVLVVALYGEGKTRGKCSELLIEAATNQAIAAIVQEGLAGTLRGFLKWFLTMNYEAIRLGSSGGVQPNLNLGIIEHTLVPVCSFTEARFVVDVLEEELSVIEELDLDLVLRIQAAQALRTSILKRAFSGQLVAQDPNDEPASLLLERIRAEKEEQAQKEKTGGARKKANKKKTAERA